VALYEKGIFPRLYRRFMHKYYANDLLIDLKLAAKRETVDYITANMSDAMMIVDRWRLLEFAVRDTKVPGLIVEAGVAKGDSLIVLAKAAAPRSVHGFDSFEGLPSDWTGTFEGKGKFTTGGKLPKVPSNAILYPGWFEQTFPRFLAATAENVSVLHVDCDIYASTKVVFELFGQRLVAGSTIVFDEYFNYPGWKNHEFKAFQEWIAATGRSYRYIAFSTEKGHVAVRLL
jgi:hypothetical protein